MVDVLFDVKVSLTFLNEFTLRAVWGVSPRSINQKRDLKTVINVQNVSFSGYDNVEEGKNFKINRNVFTNLSYQFYLL